MAKRKNDSTCTEKTYSEIQKWITMLENQLERKMTTSEKESIQFIFSDLYFSSELLDYLIQHCINLKKLYPSYIKTVAISWSEAEVKTPEQAALFMKTNELPNAYPIMSYLGQSGVPSSKEIEYINRWTNEYAFPLDIIKIACDRTVLSTVTHRFEYCNKILKRWDEADVKTLKDIEKLDAEFKKSKSRKKASEIPQHDYDFETLERELVSN